ncbi:AAA family ATPase [Thermoanaerobacter thermohydrosulfuricus]
MINNSIINKIKQKTDKQNEVSNKIITFVSARSGVGTTFLALNLAYTVSELSLKPTLFIDMDIERPDATLFFADERYKGIDDILPIINSNFNINSEILDQYITNFKKINFLFGSNVRSSELFSDGFTSKLINLTKQAYTYIFIDTGTNFINDTLLSSDVIIAVADQNVAVLSEIADMIEFLPNEIKSKTFVLINKYSDEVNFKVKDMKELFNLNFLATVSNINLDALNIMYARKFVYSIREKKYKKINNELEGVGKYIIENV